MGQAVISLHRPHTTCFPRFFEQEERSHFQIHADLLGYNEADSWLGDEYPAE